MIEFDPQLADLISRARAVDGTPPFSDGALAEYASGARQLVWEKDETGRRVGAALDSPSRAEFVIDPDARHQGHGSRMLDMLTHPARGGTGTAKLFWAHGNHEAARALATNHGLETVRTLLQLVATVAEQGDVRVIDGVTVRGFRPADADAWFALHSTAFIGHPERGDITRDQFDAMCAEDWFDAEDLVLMHEGDILVGYCWLRVIPAIAPDDEPDAEVFVAGVHPERQGAGLGHLLVEASLARLRERGIRKTHLFVESDNEPALRLCREFGFAEQSIDVQYHYSR